MAGLRVLVSVRDQGEYRPLSVRLFPDIQSGMAKLYQYCRLFYLRMASSDVNGDLGGSAHCESLLRYV